MAADPALGWGGAEEAGGAVITSRPPYFKSEPLLFFFFLRVQLRVRLLLGLGASRSLKGDGRGVLENFAQRFLQGF